MIEAIMLLLFLTCFSLCLVDLNRGFLLCVVTGLLQDPLRKLMPNQPVYFTVLVGIMVGATFTGALLRGVRLDFSPINAWNGTLRTPLKLFITLVLFQCCNAYLNAASIVVPFIGLIAYLAPLPALLLAYRYAENQGRVILFLQLYLVLCLLLLSGVYLSVFGMNWELLKSVGKGLTIYTSKGAVSLPSGFFRAPEVAAWHAGAAICFLIILATITRRQVIRWGTPVVIALLLGVIMFTGRRKMFVEVAMFIPLYGFFIAWFRQGSMKLAVPLAVLCLVMSVAIFGDVLSDETTETISPYVERAGKLQQTGVVDRLAVMTVYSFEWVVKKNGFFGSGAGMGSQGAQHFGAGRSATGSASEGGASKVLAELGVPGLLIFVWFLYHLLLYLYRVMLFARQLPPDKGNLVYGVMAFLMVNSVVFVTASQIYGDIFVLLILGWLVGFLLAVPRMASAPSAVRRGGRQWGEGTPLPLPPELSS
jgi:hypothetical protein